MALLIPINVSYNSDPDQVEQILVQEATRAAKEIPGLLADPAPLVRFIPGFGDFSLNFTLICRVQSFTDQYLAQHELRKRILRRFREEEIEMPFPQRDVRVHLMGAQGVEMARSSEEMHPGRRAHGHWRGTLPTNLNRTLVVGEGGGRERRLQIPPALPLPPEEEDLSE